MKEETLQSKALEKVTLDEIKTQYGCSSLKDLIELKEELENDNLSYEDEVEEGLDEIKELIKKHGLLDD